MTTDIKFKVWDNHQNRFVRYVQDGAYRDCYLHVHLNGYVVAFDSYGDEIDLPESRYTLVRHTGSKDKNKTPIYEGDILATDHDGGEDEANVGVVFFASGTFIIDGDGPFYEHVYSHSPDILDSHIIIGNKFENPELLNR